MFPSYRNQLVNFQSKSTDWFLYNGNIGREKVKHKAQQLFIIGQRLVLFFRVGKIESLLLDTCSI